MHSPQVDIEMRLVNSRTWLIRWLLTIGSLTFAFWPRAGKFNYDPTFVLLTATLVAVIWYTSYTFETLQHARTRDAEERLRARRSLASGLLAELRWLEEQLEQVYVEGSFPLHDILEHPLLQQAISQSTLFEPGTVGKLARFHALLRHARSVMNGYRVNPAKFPAEKREQFKYVMQTSAGFTIQALPEVVAALVAEGGVVEQRVVEAPLNQGALPPLPASPFGPRRLTHSPHP